MCDSDSMDYSPRAPVHQTVQARTLEWVAMPSSRGSGRPRDPGTEPQSLKSLALAAGSLPPVLTGKPLETKEVVREAINSVRTMTNGSETN